MLVLKLLNCHCFIVVLSLLALAVSCKKLPEASSTLLELHRRYYMQHPPHNVTLYDVLQVPPNATAATITRSYRKLSRQYHPDKCHHHDNHNPSKQQYELERIRNAYDILKEDSTRLPYHLYGCTHPGEAVAVLLHGDRRRNSEQNENPAMMELLRFMGYTTVMSTNNNNSNNQENRKKRMLMVAIHIVELLRPVVEGSIPLSVLLDSISASCDQIKSLPMGAHVLRCIGRAYRHAGQDALQLQLRQRRPQDAAILPVQQQVRHYWRRAKMMATAAVASGKVLLKEQQQQQHTRKTAATKQQQKAATSTIDYYQCDMDSLFDNEENNIDMDSDEHIKLQAQFAARQAELQSLQIDALWKIVKMDLDSTIRKACQLVLQEDSSYFFFPSHAQGDYHIRADGWVGTRSRTTTTTTTTTARRKKQHSNRQKPEMVITVEQARLRAAYVLIAIGDTMVKRSKEGTSWIE